MSATVTHVEGWAEAWSAQVLNGPPMIAPARQFVFPQNIPGEEDALARGALWLEVRPAAGGTFLAQCALGFAGNGVATDVWATPDPDTLLAIAGGYAYRMPANDPERTELLALRPVVSVHPAGEALVLVGYHGLYILEANGGWATPRLSWEGVTVTGIDGDLVNGTGWHMPSDRELPFTVNLRMRETIGGGFTP